MTPEQLQRAREQLPPFGDNAAPSPELQACCQSYGMDFTALMPQVAYQAGQLRSGEFTLAVHQWRQPDARANLLLVHGYFDVDWDAVWAVVENDLGALRSAVETILEAERE